MNSFEALVAHCAPIEKKLGYVFKDKRLLAKAFVHRSFFNEHRDIISEPNERLEFLGDAVLGLIISDYLYTVFPDYPEGELSHLRAQVVEGGACVGYVQKLDMEEHLLLGRGERMNAGKGRETILADLFEALIGAIYLDGGIEVARQFFFHHFGKMVEEGVKEPVRNWKAELQDYVQRKHQKQPTYRVLEMTGPDHNKLFVVVAQIDGQELGRGSGASKKQAEQAAAQDALYRILLKK